MNKQPITTITIAEDHPIFRLGLAQLLTGHTGFEVLGSASNGYEAVDLIQASEPDVALINFNMPGINGIQVLLKLRELRCCTKTILFSAHAETSFITAAAQAGAKGFISKHEELQEIIRIIELVAEGHSYFPASNIRKRGRIKIRDRENFNVRDVAFSPSDVQLLQLLAEGQTTEVIAEVMHLSKRTIEDNRQKLIKRMGFSNTAAMMVFAAKSGLV